VNVVLEVLLLDNVILLLVENNVVLICVDKVKFFVNIFVKFTQIGKLDAKKEILVLHNILTT
jgi:hypothetical protein